MDVARSVADSHEWEHYCKQLLSIRHGDQLQLIDASRIGDLGLEAFTRDTGLGFQCYAPLEELGTKERYEKQRDKLTADLNKLVSNEAELVGMLAGVRLCRYVLMTPRFDPPLLTHCGAKTQQMRDLTLAILDPAFDIVVHTDENYPAERAQLIELALQPLELEIPDIELERREKWATVNVGLVDTLTEKIAKFGLEPTQADELRDELLGHYLRREQLLEQILNVAPDTHVRIERRIRQREHLLATERLMSSQAPLEHAKTVISVLMEEMLADAKTLQISSAEALAYGTAADWMARCPLDF